MLKRRAAIAASLLLAGLSAGCTQEIDAPGDIGYVLLDRTARGAMTVAQDGWEGAPILPVALDLDESITLRGPTFERSLWPRGGMLAHVRGPEGAITWLRLGEEMREDHLVIHGTEAASGALAELIGGEAAQRGDGLWTIAAEDVLVRTSFLDPPEGVLEALPDTRLDVSDLVAPEVARVAIQGLGAEGAGHDIPPAGSTEAEIVGLYAAGERSLLLDASGGFMLSDRCTGEILEAGRFYATGDRVVLQSGSTAPMVLGRGQDMLLHPGGATFAPLLPEATERSRRDLDLDEDEVTP